MEEFSFQCSRSEAGEPGNEVLCFNCILAILGVGGGTFSKVSPDWSKQVNYLSKLLFDWWSCNTVNTSKHEKHLTLKLCYYVSGIHHVIISPRHSPRSYSYCKRR